MFRTLRTFALLLFAGALSGCPGAPAIRPIELVPVYAAHEFQFEQVKQEREYWIGEPIAKAELQGRPLLVYLWSKSCEHCRATIPWIRQVQRDFPEILLLSVVDGSSEGAVAELKQMGAARSIYRDIGDLLFDEFSADGWPTYVLIDSAGQIRARAMGRATPGSPRAKSLESALTRLSTGAR